MASGQHTEPPSGSFKGNKRYLPSKPCLRCGRDMVWRKAWAKNWDQVLYCSERCRSARGKTGIV